MSRNTGLVEALRSGNTDHGVQDYRHEMIGDGDPTNTGDSKDGGLIGGKLKNSLGVINRTKNKLANIKK